MTIAREVFRQQWTPAVMPLGQALDVRMEPGTEAELSGEVSLREFLFERVATVAWGVPARSAQEVHRLDTVRIVEIRVLTADGYGIRCELTNPVHRVMMDRGSTLTVRLRNTGNGVAFAAASAIGYVWRVW